MSTHLAVDEPWLQTEAPTPQVSRVLQSWFVPAQDAGSAEVNLMRGLTRVAEAAANQAEQAPSVKDHSYSLKAVEKVKLNDCPDYKAADRPYLKAPQCLASGNAGDATAYQLMQEILDRQLTKWVAQHNLSAQFAGDNCHHYIGFPPDGSVSATLTSRDGHRLTLLCRADGTSVARITEAGGRELARILFNQTDISP
jgi:hypothetical protein